MSAPYSPTPSATLQPFAEFNAQKDAEVLHNATKGFFGSDKDGVVNIVGRRSFWQMKEIATAFKADYGNDLVEKLNSHLSGDLCKLVQLRFYSPAELDAWCIHHASSVITDDHCLIEILCSRTNEEIRVMKETFERMFNKNFEKTIERDASGDFRRLLVSLLQGQRDESPEVNHDEVRTDASALYNAGEARWGTDDSVFNKILVTRSYRHLNALFEEYNKIASHDFSVAIKKELSGHLQEAMLAIVDCVRNKHLYFANKLHKSLKGLIRDDTTLQRIICSRCEIDMGDIKTAFMNEYQMPLSQLIDSDCSGEYKKILMLLTGH